MIPVNERVLASGVAAHCLDPRAEGTERNEYLKFFERGAAGFAHVSGGVPELR